MSGDLLPGREIDGYRILGKLGSGGMGAVYAGIHSQIERLVAIKVLHRALSHDEVAASRFMNEARAVNLIRHPNIVSIERLGQLPDGSAYLIMEHLEGQTLTSRLKWGGGRLGPVTLHFTRQIADALASAHDKGVVHCDLKPANVMVVIDPETPGGERVKLVDFGIARLSKRCRLDHNVSDGGCVVGTPLYMSPEQCSGAENIDGKSDVYSLGILLFQLVAGHPPFTNGSVSDILERHRSERAPSLSDLVGSVPPSLSVLVAAMLEKEPFLRPTMREVSRQLDALYRFPMKPIPIERRIEWRRWMVYGSVAFTVLLGVASIGLLTTPSIKAFEMSFTSWTIVLLASGWTGVGIAWRWLLRSWDRGLTEGV